MVLGQIDTIPAEREALDDVSNGQEKKLCQTPRKNRGRWS